MRLLFITASTLILAACSETAAAPAQGSEPPAAEAAAPAADVEYGSAGTYTLDKNHASLTWRVSHFGLSQYTGRFTDFDATLDFHPDDPSATRLTATINPSSAETDYPGDYKAGHANSGFETWNEDLARNANWFNADQFPEITFATTSVSPATANTGTVTGDLTFLGVTKPVTLDVTYNGVANFPWAPDTDKIGFSARTTLKRSEFGQTALAPNIGDEVEIIIETEFDQVVTPAEE